ncbi:MAG: phosphoribosylglycinamide formyltransferase [bacterium]|nr:phosphoribosylglycinamide formyltransferase [bacterium]
MRISVLGSGTGTNFVAIAQAVARGELRNVDIALVLSDIENAGILARAQEFGVPCAYIPVTNFKTKLEGPPEQAYIEALRAAGTDYVVLAGFMRMIKREMLAAFPQRIINIHPALLPAFPGIHSWEQALAYGVKITGCTVHFVDEGMDTGPIIAQAAVPVHDDDTPASLHARIQQEEHRLYPRVLQWLADGRVHIQGRRTFLVPPGP